MPLSEEELRLLEQMERALSEEDPKFASTLRGTSLRRSARRRAAVAGVVFAGGVALLMTGAITKLWYVGVVGFVLMLGSAMVGLTAMHSRNAPASADPRASGHPGLSVIDGGRANRMGRSGRGRSRGSSSFMERMEQRWRRRRDEGGL